MSPLPPQQDSKVPFNWSALRSQLDQSRADAAPSPDAERAILKQRARELARRTSAGKQISALPEHVILTIAGERYLVEAARVREAIAVREITPLPGAPAAIQGIAAVRGRVVAVADLRRLFGLPDISETGSGKLVVIEHRGVEFGVVVDAVTVPQSSLMLGSAASSASGGPDAKFLRGVTPEGLILLDLSAITGALTVNEEL
jgi:purine-binding chemotaxis protein CheW